MKLCSALLLLAFGFTESFDSGCYNKAAAFKHDAAYASSKCCSFLPNIDWSAKDTSKCSQICEPINDDEITLMNECERRCLYREHKLLINGTYNKEAVKKEFMNSISDVELAKKYDAIIDESIRICDARGKFHLLKEVTTLS